MVNNVLCIAPYSNYHAIHGLWELTMLNGLRLRGAAVEYYLCNGLAECCDFFRITPAKKDCKDCMVRSANVAQSLQMPFGWLGSVLTPDDAAAADAFAASQSAGSFFEASSGDYQIGRWIQSSVHTYFREVRLNQSDPVVERCCRSYLRAGLLYALASDRIIRRFSPDVLLLFNARMAFVKIPAEVGALRGVPYYSHERGWLPERISINRDDIPVSREYFNQLWDLWGDVPLSRAELDKINKVLRNRERGKDLNWVAFSPPPGTAKNLRTQLGIPDGKRIWGLFTSSEDEVVCLPDFVPGAFDSQIEWIVHTLALLRTMPEIHLVIRVHPNTGGSKAGGDCLGTLRFFEVLKQRLPENVTLVGPDDPVSTYDIMDASEAGMVFISTCALEMGYRGKATICASEAYYAASGVASVARDEADYERMVRQWHLSPPLRSTDRVRRSLRFLYAAIFRADIAFPLIPMSTPYTGHLGYSSLAELAEGREPNLDMICRMILDRGAVLSCPSRAEKHRSGRDELEWLSRIPIDWQEAADEATG